MSDTLTLVLLRHGQSTWNLENIFTGWTDVPLSDHGRDEAKEILGARIVREASVRLEAHLDLLLRAYEDDFDLRVLIDPVLTHEVPCGYESDHHLHSSVRCRHMLRGAHGLRTDGRSPTAHSWWQSTNEVGHQWYVSSDWQGWSEKLFSAAAEVAAKLAE